MIIPIQELVVKWLTENGYDGLYDGDECGCSCDDIMPCGYAENLIHCSPAYLYSDRLLHPNKPAKDKECL